MTKFMCVEAKNDLSANAVAAVEHRLYEHNREATGARDGRDLGFVVRDETGDVVGAALGYSWAGIAELRQLWIAKGYRRRCTYAIGALALRRSWRCEPDGSFSATRLNQGGRER